jgi:hypothetical protein
MRASGRIRVSDGRRESVGDAAQEALAGQRDQRERQPQRADAQVVDRQLAHPAVAAHEVNERHGERGQQRRERDPDSGGQPQRLRRQPPGGELVARAVVARHLRRRAVGEEVEEREGAGEERGGDRQRGQLLGAEMADHRGVRQEVQRLGGERAECGQGEAEDLPVVLGAPAHYSRTK